VCSVMTLQHMKGLCASDPVKQCFSTFVRPRPGKLFFYKMRARGPTNLLINTFPFFLSSHINPLPALTYQNVLDLNVTCQAKRTGMYVNLNAH
jgi:hypothetical protein